MTDPMEERRRQFDVLRRERPLYRDQPSGTFVLTRMADAKVWLADPDQWKDADRAEPDAILRTFKPADMNRPGDRDAAMLWLDNPDHARVRRPIQQAFVRRLGRFGPDLEAIVDAILERLPGDGFDIVEDVALPVPVTAMGRILGIDTSDLAQFRIWSEAALNVFSPEPSEAGDRARKDASEAMSDYLDAAMADRRRTPRDDLISDLIACQAAGAPLSDSEIRVNCMNLLLGGNVTTADLIASTVNLLLRNPAELAKLRANPGLINGVVEETLRLEPPSDGAQRVASRDLEMHGCPVKAHQVVMVMIPAANRDPDVFSEPDTFRIDRREGPHIAFGAGAHICIGAPLARLETKTTVSRLVARFPELRLAEPDAPAHWRTTPFFRGLEALPVRV